MATLKEDLSRDLTNAEKLVFGAEAWVDKEGKIIERGIGNMFDRTKAAAVAQTPATVPVAAPASVVPTPVAAVPAQPSAAPASVVPTPVAAVPAQPSAAETLGQQIKDDLRKAEDDIAKL